MYKNRIIIIVLLLVQVNYPAISQKPKILKNTFSIAPISLLAGNLSMSYHRQIDEYLSFFINPRIQLRAYPDETGPFFWADYWDYIDFPFLYNRLIARGGVSVNYKHFFFEPLMQYDYGIIKKQWFVLSESPERETALVDCKYNSIGAIGLIGFKWKKKKRYTKIYYGFGVHKRYYYERINRYNYFYRKKLPRNREWNKVGKSFHFGLELGYNF